MQTTPQPKVARAKPPKGRATRPVAPTFSGSRLVANGLAPLKMPQVAGNISFTIALTILILLAVSSGCASKAMHSSATDIISSEEITITPAGIDLILTEPITRQPKDIRLSILLDLRPSVAKVRKVIIPDDVNSVQLEAVLIATDGREVHATHSMPLANTATSVLFAFDEEIESEFSIDRVRIASNRDLLCKQVAAIYYFNR